MTLQLCNLVVHLPGKAVLTTHKHIPWTTQPHVIAAGMLVSLFLFIERTENTPDKRMRFDLKRRPSISSKDVPWSKIRLEDDLDQINIMI